jgi:peptidoglycan hydrolase CwlO-like protein
LRRPVAICLLLAAVCAAASARAGAQGEGVLRQRIGSAKAREQSLAGAIARLARLERATEAQIAVLQGRVADAQAQLNAAEARLAATQAQLAAAQRRVARLRKRLAQVRRTLATLLRERYEGDRPDFVTVVLHSDGFPQLLENLTFLHRVERSDAHILAIVAAARVDAAREQRVLSALAVEREREAVAVRLRRDALAGMLAGLQSRREQLARARAAHQAALTRTRAGRRRAERALSHLLALRAAAARATGPGGPWAVPWPIVQCESGGQNLPPNSAGASGYYQMLDTTWHGLGGSTPHAYQASKAEQDRLAARLWAGGAGAHNWVCAGMVDG